MAVTEKTFTILQYATRDEMGAAAAEMLIAKANALLEEKECLNMIFAAAPSQSEFLNTLAVRKDFPAERINAFHMDEYIGLRADAPQGFGNFLMRHLFGRRQFRSVSLINGQATDAAAECARYAALLRENPVDIVCMGIGENGHIAFNDPPVADFKDDKLVKIVELDQMCRTQQVNDGCFAHINEVPTHAVTLTVPALANAEYQYCIVPAQSKANAVYDTIYGPISESCPASILRTCRRPVLFLDADSAARLWQ